MGDNGKSQLPEVISEEFLTCKICLQSYHQPKILACLHSFCRKCLHDHAGKDEKVQAIVCPLCRQVTAIPAPGGVAKLKDNFFINNLKETLDLSQISKPKFLTPPCDSCRNRGDMRASHMRCLDCNELLCKDCISAHERLTLTKNHKMVAPDVTVETRPISDEDTTPRPSMCKDHTDEVCKLYCNRCQILICVTCKLTTHDGHPCCGLTTAAAEARDQLTQQLAALKQRHAEYGHLLENWRSYERELDQQKHALASRLDRRRRELHTFVDGWHYASVQQLKAICHNERKLATTKVQTIDVRQEALLAVIQLTEHIVAHTHQRKLLALQEQLSGDINGLRRENINDLRLTQKSMLKFESGSQVLNFDKFGILTESHEKVITSRWVKQVQSLTFICGFETRPECSGSKYDASSIAVSSFDNHLIVTDRQLDRVTMYTSLGDRVQFINTARFGKAVCAIAMQTGDIVFCRDKSSIYVFDSNIRQKHIIRESTARPSNLTVARNNDLYVLDYGLRTVTRFCGKTYKCIGRMAINYKKRSIWDSIAVTSKGNVYVCSYGQHCLYEYTPTGQLLARYGRQGTNDPGDLDSPRGLCIDQHDNVIIADTNNSRVQMLTPYGAWSLLRLPEGSTLRSPTDVAVDSQGRLYVLEKCGAVKVFDYHF
ncbi:E3 ubiquitin-protein ligase TRIM71 [Lamellibrachia satsuma]|nr:E3 ubiquitin-protein ligase TRIM71 [Lamellibrachia satsuma]